jgi:hypothetical protein
MSNTIPGLLTDTYNLVQMARESALAQGKQAQVNKLSPVVQDLKTLVNPKDTRAATTTATSTQTTRAAGKQPAQASGMMGQSDFQALLNAAKAVPNSPKVASSNNITERNQMVRSMAAGNMMDVDIARSMGMTREEVRLILSVGGK